MTSHDRGVRHEHCDRCPERIADSDAEYQRYARVLISHITWMEVMAGVRNDEEGVRDFLASRFEIVALDDTIAELAVQLRRTHRLRLPDAIIWATAKAHAAVLVTRNTKDFEPGEEGIRVPYRLMPP